MDAFDVRQVMHTGKFGAVLLGVKEDAVMETAMRANGDLVVINSVGQKFVYDAATVREAMEWMERGLKSGSGGKVKKTFDTIERKEEQAQAKAVTAAKKLKPRKKSVPDNADDE